MPVGDSPISIELREIRYFLAVAETLHFSRAARGLGLTQPSLSQQIRKLEEKLDVELFMRTSRGVTLTPAGATFRESAQRVVNEAERASQVARDLAAGRVGRLVVGSIGSALNSILPVVARRLSDVAPGLVVDFHEMETSLQLTALVDRRIDVGFVRPRSHGLEIDVEVLFSEELLVALSKNHPLARRRKIRVEDLADQPLLLWPRFHGPEVYDELIAACRRAGFSPRIASESTGTMTILTLAAAGLGITFIPSSLAGLGSSGLRLLPLEAATSIEVAVAWRRFDTNPAVALLLELTRSVAQGGSRDRFSDLTPPVTDRGAPAR